VGCEVGLLVWSSKLDVYGLVVWASKLLTMGLTGLGIKTEVTSWITHGTIMKFVSRQIEVMKAPSLFDPSIDGLLPRVFELSASVRTFWKIIKWFVPTRCLCR